MDKNNKNEASIVLRPYVDYRDPEQCNPWGHVWYVWNWDTETLEFDPSNGEWSEKK